MHCSVSGAGAQTGTTRFDDKPARNHATCPPPPRKVCDMQAASHACKAVWSSKVKRMPMLKTVLNTDGGDSVIFSGLWPRYLTFLYWQRSGAPLDLSKENLCPRLCTPWAKESALANFSSLN